MPHRRYVWEAMALVLCVDESQIARYFMVDEKARNSVLFLAGSMLGRWIVEWRDRRVTRRGEYAKQLGSRNILKWPNSGPSWLLGRCLNLMAPVPCALEHGADGIEGHRDSALYT